MIAINLHIVYTVAYTYVFTVNELCVYVSLCTYQLYSCMHILCTSSAYMYVVIVLHVYRKHYHLLWLCHTCTYIYICNTFTPHIKASRHAAYIMLHSLGVLQLPKCGTTSQWNVVQLPNGMWYNFPLECRYFCLYTFTHNALSHSSNWLHIQSINLV